METTTVRATRSKSKNKNKNGKSVESVKPRKDKGFTKRKNEITKSFFEKSDLISSDSSVDTCNGTSFYSMVKNSTKEWKFGKWR
jgi:hypothetical protein